MITYDQRNLVGAAQQFQRDSQTPAAIQHGTNTLKHQHLFMAHQPHCVLQSLQPPVLVAREPHQIRHRTQSVQCELLSTTAFRYFPAFSCGSAPRLWWFASSKHQNQALIAKLRNSARAWTQFTRRLTFHYLLCQLPS